MTGRYIDRKLEEEQRMRAFEGYQKGVNLGGWLSQCVSTEQVHFDTFIQETDIEKISRSPLSNGSKL